MIRNSPVPFFEELGEQLLLIGEEIRPDEFVEDRIDLLAIDQQGSTVVIELKRGSHKLHLLQSLAYAAMISKWDQGKLIAECAKFTGRDPEAVEEEIEEFLEEHTGQLNGSQRVMLLAEDFDYEPLITAEWLAERYGVDIRCYRLVLSTDGESEFLTCTGVYPPPELTKYAIRRARESRPTRWRDWEEALQSMDNTAMEEFFKSERP